MQHEIVRKRLALYRGLEKEMRQLEEEIAHLETRVYDVQAMVIRDEARGQRQNRSMDLLVKLMAMRETYTQKWDEMIDMRFYIEEAIDALEPLERQLMRARYIEGKKWDDICTLICYSRRHVATIHENALGHVGRYLSGSAAGEMNRQRREKRG